MFLEPLTSDCFIPQHTSLTLDLPLSRTLYNKRTQQQHIRTCFFLLRTHVSMLRPARDALLRTAVRAIWDGENRRPASVIAALLRNSSEFFLNISGFSNRGYRVWGGGVGWGHTQHVHNTRRVSTIMFFYFIYITDTVLPQCDLLHCRNTITHFWITLTTLYGQMCVNTSTTSLYAAAFQFLLY